MTIQSYEIRALDDFGGRIHWIPSDLGAWCPADSVRRLEADMETLKAEVAALKAPPKALSAEDVEEEGWYWSVDNEEFVQIDCDPTILPWQLSMWRVSSSVCSRLQGQFIGPLRLPEEV